VTGWGWFYLSTVLDDFSRYIVAWKLCTTMKAQNVTDTLAMALAASGCDQARIVHKPRLLSDNGSSYVSADLAEWLEAQNIEHVHGAPYHPQTQGKIERWHQTASCWRTIICREISKPASGGSSITTTIDGIKRKPLKSKSEEPEPPVN
jgi:transposase InsO family protein